MPPGWSRSYDVPIRAIRPYFPKYLSLKDLSQDDLDAVAARLNTRPRKTLKFDTPADRIQALLH